jgi:biotin transport system substrate-specific component
MDHSISSPPLVNAIAARSESTRAVRVASMLFITALTAAAAQVSVPLPFTDVPFTFQPMVVLLGGLALGSRLGLASQVLYLALGVAGLPVFAASPLLPPGLLRLLGPTGGYLMAYPLAAFVVGYLAECGLDRRYVTSLFAMLAGLIVIYASGAVWLGLFAGQQAVGLANALALGVYPFVPADLLKLLVAASVLPGLWRLFGRTDARGPHHRR